MSQQNFIKRHWNGEISLPLAYWGIGALLSNSIILTVTFLIDKIESFTPSLTYTSWMFMLYYPFIWIFLLWIYVGVWRSATKYMENGSSKIWGYLAKFSIAGALLQTFVVISTVHYPAMKQMSQFVFGSDPLGAVIIEVIDDGKTLYVKGPFGNGSSNAIISALDKNPSIKRLSLDSIGGRLKEVKGLSVEVQKRALETYTEESCLSFCTIIFLSGSPRYSTPEARIGFHAPHGFNSELLNDIGVDDARNLYKTFNLPKPFIDKIFSTPNSDMWFPGYQELVSLGVVSNLSLGGESNRLQNELKNYSTDQIKESILKTPLFAAYEKKFPGIVKQFSEKMSSSSKEDFKDSDILNASRSFMAAYQLKAIAQSTPQIRISFSDLAFDQSKYIAKLGPRFCKAFIEGNLNLTKNLPKELVAREMQITISALESDFVPAYGYSFQKYEDVIQRAARNMSDEEIDAIYDLSGEPTENTCSGLVEFYRGIKELPPQQRDIAVYGMMIQ